MNHEPIHCKRVIVACSTIQPTQYLITDDTLSREVIFNYDFDRTGDSRKFSETLIFAQDTSLINKRRKKKIVMNK